MQRHHCCGECVASLCGFTAAASVSAVRFQFCKPGLHLFSLAPPPSSKLTLMGGAASPQAPPLVSTGNSRFTLLKKSPQTSLPRSPPPAPHQVLRDRVLDSSKDLLCYLEVRGSPQPQSSWLCVTRQGVKAMCLGSVGFLLLMSLKTAIHTRNGEAGWHCITEIEEIRFVHLYTVFSISTHCLRGVS